jgi:hypothetical protein
MNCTEIGINPLSIFFYVYVSFTKNVLVTEVRQQSAFPISKSYKLINLRNRKYNSHIIAIDGKSSSNVLKVV